MFFICSLLVSNETKHQKMRPNKAPRLLNTDLRSCVFYGVFYGLYCSTKHSKLSASLTALDEPLIACSSSVAPLKSNIRACAGGATSACGLFLIALAFKVGQGWGKRGPGLGTLRVDVVIGRERRRVVE